MFRVLLSNVHRHLKVLTHVEREKFLKAVQSPLAAQCTEEFSERLRVYRVCVDDTTLQVGELRVVLHGSNVKTSLLAELRDARAVVVRELSLRQDRISDVRVCHQVDLKNLGLQRRLALVVALEQIEQDRCRLTNHVALQEEIGDGPHVARWRCHLTDLLCQLHRARGIFHHKSLQHVHIVWLVIDGGAVLRHLVEFATLRERCGYLRTRACFDVNLKRSIGVSRRQHVAEFFARLELVLAQPCVEKLLLVLRKHELCEFN